jgi:TolB-like protein/DNA-binding SARP family transcriptional activator
MRVKLAWRTLEPMVRDMDTPARSRLRVRMLGGFELTSADGGDLTPPRKKLRALVALLALPPATGWSREQLTALLWGDRDEEQARGSLRQALAELRRTLGPSALVANREMAAFNPAVVSVDAVELAHLAAAGELDEAAALYRGALLEGVSLPDAGFADWVLVERTRLHDLAVDVLARLLHTQSGEVAIATAGRLLQLDPTREETHRALMQLYVAQGDRSRALRQYQICRDIVRRDLEVEPDPETERLYSEIRSSSKYVTAGQDGPPRHGETRNDSAQAAQNDRLPPTTMPPPGRLLPPTSLWSRLGAAAVVALALAGGGTWWFWPNVSPSAKPVVAVLPFDNVADDPASRRLADGLTEDVITDLARLPEFGVIARNSIESYEGKPVDVRAIAAALQADFVVNGSIQRDGERIRISAQLVDAKTGKNLWSERWDRPDGDLFAVQAEISEQIANRLGGGAGLVQEAGRIAAHRKPPSDLTAYELYLLGTEKLEQINVADLQEAISLLNRAVEIDPKFARAWIELFHSHKVLASFGVEPEKNTRIAFDAAERAVRLDPSDAEAHAVFGISLGHQNDLVGAKAELDAALRLASGAAEILTFYSVWASSFGEPDRGADMVDQVIRLNPNYPMWSARLFAYAYFQAGRYENALHMMDRLTLDNYAVSTWAMRPSALASTGRTDEAKIWVQKALERHPDLTIEGIANEPGYNSAERQRFIDGMRLAGFPPCAKPEALAKIEQPVRLPECASQASMSR